MYARLAALSERPAPFSVYTAAALWNDPHISSQMLAAHLDPTTDKASRKPAAIDRLVRWLDARVGLSGKRVCDLGCGPGLYAERLGARGAFVTGVDFSERSIDHARRSAETKELSIGYRLADYLNDELPAEQDVVTLVYGDYCVLSPVQRRSLLARIRAMLRPGGHVLLDVFSPAQFDALEEGFLCERRLMNGFWAPGDYFGFKVTHLYPELRLALDRYWIVAPDQSKELFNWMQYFSPDEIAAELTDAGFAVSELFDLDSGRPWRARAAPFGVLATRTS